MTRPAIFRRTRNARVGPIFQALDTQDRVDRIRIENVVAFIESIHVR